MIAHDYHSREPSLTSPPPPPKDVSTRQSVSSTSHSTSSPTRIKRKPLPSTALSPRSRLSSPRSISSQQQGSSQYIDVPQSSVTLNEILNSPPQSQPFQTFYHEESPLSDTSSSPSPRPPSRQQRSFGNPSLNDFPRPPSRQVAVRSPPHEDPLRVIREEEDMGTTVEQRPPPLRIDSIKVVKAMDAKKPQSPGSVFTSFFGRRQNTPPQNTSPGGESSTTEISEGRSPLPSPYPGSVDDTSSYFAQTPMFVTDGNMHTSPHNSQDSSHLKMSVSSSAHGSVLARCDMLEAELKEISKELAGSIRRELDLEDLVDRLQSEAPPAPMSADRTSDYFSDSGTSSVRHQDSALTPKEEIDKIKREAEQQRAQMRMELSQKWQDEVGQRKLLESHVALLESKVQQSRRDTNDTSDTSARIRELETNIDDARRRLTEERQTKENFEDLLTALKVDLEQHRNERDNLRDEVVPNLRSQIEGLEASLADTQKHPYDFARMQQEIQSLRDENAALSSARKMEQDLMRGMGQISEDDDLASVRSSLILPKTGGLGRSNTVAGRGNSRASLSRSGSLSRSSGNLNRPLPDAPDAVTDKLNAVEQQRDALHSTAKLLRKRLEIETKKYERRIASLQTEIRKTGESVEMTRKGGYEREVRALRQEINVLRRRADDAIDQKWQCEKGLAGLNMDLDRSKQETASLQQLLQFQGSDDPEVLSGSLEKAIEELQRARTAGQESMGSLQAEQRLAHQLEESAERSEALAAQVREQLEANSSLRQRLMHAVEKGEKNQQASANQINNLQGKLKKLEDTITSAQLQSETAVMKHEDEIRNLKAAQNAQLQRADTGMKSPYLGSGARTPLSPMFANSKRSPRLDQTSTGPGQTLQQALKMELMQKKVAELEKALSDAESGMEEVVGRMNQAQIGVFELQQERDEALRRTRKLEADIVAERERFQMLVTGGAAP